MNDNDITGNGSAKTAEESNSTAPVNKPTGGWSMPDPVFRQTSGYLPKGFEDQFGKVAQAVSDEDAEPEFDPLITLYSPPTGHLEPPTESVDEIELPEPVIEPGVIAQPDLDEVVIEDSQSSIVVPPKKKKSAAVKSAIAATFIFVMLGAAVAFIVLVYYFFLREYGW